MEEAFAAAVYLEDNSRKQFYASLLEDDIEFMTGDEINRSYWSVSPEVLLGYWQYHYNHYVRAGR